MKTFDTKCFELAQHFLADSPNLRAITGKADELASEIQQCIEDWIQGEESGMAAAPSPEEQLRIERASHAQTLEALQRAEGARK